MKNRGITLIALAVTVIVLLIISGVTISYMTGENGIINQSKEKVCRNSRRKRSIKHICSCSSREKFKIKS